MNLTEHAALLNYRSLARRCGEEVADHYLEMVKKQNYLCDICKEPRKLVMDHSHSTHLCRSPLCTRCNNAVGRVEGFVLETWVGGEVAAARAIMEYILKYSPKPIMKERSREISGEVGLIVDSPLDIPISQVSSEEKTRLDFVFSCPPYNWGKRSGYRGGKERISLRSKKGREAYTVLMKERLEKAKKAAICDDYETSTSALRRAAIRLLNLMDNNVTMKNMAVLERTQLRMAVGESLHTTEMIRTGVNL